MLHQPNIITNNCHCFFICPVKRNKFCCFHVTQGKPSVIQICSFVLFTGGLDLSSSAPAPVTVQNNSFLANTNQSSNFLVDELLNCEPVTNSKLKHSFFKKYILLLGDEYQCHLFFKQRNALLHRKVCWYMLLDRKIKCVSAHSLTVGRIESAPCLHVRK